jgi:hypothetical protein
MIDHIIFLPLAGSGDVNWQNITAHNDINLPLPSVLLP